ncbi:PREDICTED: interferon alpha-inducible protein 27-like protein 2B [Wasmannia auropunctata]|uniref:interferon alpha-inducible protein 27-like protein 2B n=1 Tax=Wasmannia auropunctata TaxID=64793 RepID=UPI0005EDA310|nr:PREDICTED: interferon alpha-inducible protein 27-like protein 2B [Wasmannia auropunctata]
MYSIIIIGSTGGIVGGIAGCAALPFLGFGLAGISAGSIAASWQASIGAVAAGSLFATLQSLGASGLGMLLFGPAGAVIGLLISIAASLNWWK